MSWERKRKAEEEEELAMMMMEVEEEEGSSEQRSGAVTWDKLLAKGGSLRVLLVEGDDSTRQIITALLRKCNYKVSTVSDGSEAWEVLKERPQLFDIVLTEVEVPSISGTSLLSMIMDQETCKHIPVIMMSSHDSVNMVFKCMLKGAADFLVKPVRKNELRNLWQHAWRRRTQALTGGHGVHEADIPEKPKIDDNSLKGNKLTGVVPSMNKNTAFSEKGSDAESSCTRSDMEAESTYKQTDQEKMRSNTSFVLHQRKAEVTAFGENCIPNDSLHKDESSCPHKEMHHHKNVSNEIEEGPTDIAINLISRIDNQRECSNGQIDDVVVQTRDFIGLELSLKSCRTADKEEMNQCSTLNHSNSSPFSQYNNQMSVSSALKIGNSRAESEDYSSPSTERIHEKGFGNMSNPPIQGGVVNCAPLRVMPIHIPVGGITFGAGSEYGIVMKPATYPNPSAFPLWSSIPSNGQEVMHMSQSQTSNLCSESLKSPTEDLQMEVRQLSDLNRLQQREAALNKFRMKKKDRCFEKKVRYQSRKRLAEQRPRVKGQFVRHTDTPTSEACT